MNPRVLVWLPLAILALLFSSCDKDSINTFTPSPEEAVNFNGFGVDFKVENSMLTFNSLSDFEQFSEQMLENGAESEDDLSNLIENVMANSDFSSLHPDVEFEKLSETRINQYVETLSKRTQLVENVYDVNAQNSDLNFAEFIADPSLSSILNIDGKIKIGSTTYSYTPFGLFMTKSSEGDNELARMLTDSEDIKDIIQTNENSRGAITELTNHVTYFIPEVIPFNEQESSLSFRDLDENQLAMCGGSNSSTVWNWAFGPSSDCSDHFSDRRRVKTKIWNQNYLLFSSLGTNVRSQSRRFRVWWAKKVDELELGTGFFNYEFDLPEPPVPANLSAPGILAAQFSDGTIIGLNGQILNSGPLFDRLTSISQNLPFIPVVDEDWVELRLFVDLGFLELNETFSAADYLNFREIVDDFIEDQVPDLLRRAGGIQDADQVEIIDAAGRRMQVAADILNRNRSNIANMKHYFDFNTAQIGISGNPSIPGGIGVDLSNILNAYDYDQVRGLVYGAGRDGNTVRGNWVGMEQDN